MNKILDIKHLSLLVFGIVLTAVSVFNAFMYAGLIEDGAYRFFEALTCRNFLFGSGNFWFFPYNVRYFSGIFSHFAVGFSVHWLGFINIKYLLYIFTFVSYFKYLIFTVIIYLNLPKNKKNHFEMILLSFLLTFTFTSYQIWAENIITGLFIWVLFVIFYYVDFDKLTVFNKFCIVIFSVMLISSHQMVLVFVPVLLTIALKKHISARNLKISSEGVLRISYMLLFASITFNLFSIFDLFFGGPPTSGGQIKKYIVTNQLFDSPAFVLTFVFVMIILILSFVRNDKKNDKVKWFITIILLLCILYLLLFKITTCGNFSNITLGFHIPLLFFIIILVTGLFKIKIEYKYIKLVNLTLCIVIYLNSLHYGLFWKHYLTNINQYIINNKKIAVYYSEKPESAYPILTQGSEDEMEKIFPSQYNSVHFNYILYILIFMEGLFGKYNLNDFVSIKTPPGYICNDTKHSTTFFVIDRKEALKKFGINIDSFVKVNGSALLK